MQEIADRVGGQQGRDHRGDEGVRQPESRDQADAGDHHGAHRHRADHDRHDAPDHPVKQRQAQTHHQRREDERVAHHRAQLRSVERHRTGHRGQPLTHRLLAHRIVECLFHGLALPALLQFVRAHHQCEHLAVARGKPAGHEAVGQHTLQALIGRPLVQPFRIDQGLDDEAVRTACNVIDPSDGEHPIDIGVRFHAPGDAVERAEHLGRVKIVTLEQGDEDLIVRKLRPQFAFQHRRRRIRRKVELGGIVEFETEQQRTTDQMDDQDDRHRRPPAKQLGLRHAQQDALQPGPQHGREPISLTRSPCRLRTRPASPPTRCRCARRSHPGSARRH